MRAAERAYATVRDGILHGKYDAGTRLTEQDLARTAGVSRTPIREALRRLHAEGLVQFEPNHGAVVSFFGIEDAEEISSSCARRSSPSAQAVPLSARRPMPSQSCDHSRSNRLPNRLGAPEII